MKLPKLSLRLPKLRLPFGKRGADGGGAGPGPDDDLEGMDAGSVPALGAPDPEDAVGRRPSSAAKDPERLKRIAGTVGTAALAVLVIGGTGGLVGWLLVNGAQTAEMRKAAQPQLTVAILKDGETPEPNSSTEPAMHHEEESHAEAAKEGEPKKGEGGKAEGAEPKKEAAPTRNSPAPVTSKDGVRLAAVDPAMIEQKQDAKLPIVAPDGRQSWTTYARPFNHDDTRPRVAIVLTGLGLSKKLTDVVISELPGAISLSFSPYAPEVDKWLDAARKAGHEVLLDLPLEPLDFPRDDPGPWTLLTSLSTVDNLNRLETVLGRGTGYVGLTAVMGTQFTTVEDALMPVLEQLKQRGLMLLDGRSTSRSIASELASSIQLPRTYVNRQVDQQLSPQAIDRALADVETTARQLRFAVGLSRPYPVAIDRIKRWTAGLDARGIMLAPVSSVADRQRLR